MAVTLGARHATPDNPITLVPAPDDYVWQRATLPMPGFGIDAGDVVAVASPDCAPGHV
eukprot:SAG11_NODE_16553_length_544_cov_1.006742_1_plen_57_part_10